MPIIALDFSQGNLTFGRDLNLHKADKKENNDYRALLQMLAFSYENVTNLPIFGYAAKTYANSKQGAPIFPLSRSIRNPFTSNDDEAIDIAYDECLKVLSMSLPVNLNPVLMLSKQLGTYVRKRLSVKAMTNKSMEGTIDSVYVMYIISTGLVDDV